MEKLGEPFKFDWGWCCGRMVGCTNRTGMGQAVLNTRLTSSDFILGSQLKFE